MKARYYYYYDEDSGAPAISVYGNSVLIANGDSSPSPLDHTNYGDVLVGAKLTRTFTIKNADSSNVPGTADLENLVVAVPDGYVVVSQPTSPVAPGASATFQVRCETEADQVYAGNISITGDDGISYSFAVTCNSDLPVMQVVGNAININSGDIAPSLSDGTDFGNTLVLTTVSKTFTVNNTGLVPLTLSVSAPSGYTLTSAPSSPVAAGGSTTFTIRCNAATETVIAGTVSITNNSGTTPYTFAITCNSDLPEIQIVGNSVNISNGDATPSLTDNTNFGDTLVGTTVSKTYTIQNSGVVPLTLGTLTVPSGYTVTSAPSSPVAAGGSTTFTVRCNAASDAVFAGNVSLDHNSHVSPYVFAITCNSDLPVITVTPSSWNFGSTPVGTPVSKIFTILNSGLVTMTITLPITGDNAAFTITVPPPVTSLAPGASTTFTVQATAASGGTPSGNISIASNAAGSPTLVAVTAHVFEWIFLDQFTPDDASPLTTPRTASGAGTATIIQVDGTLDIAGNDLDFTAQASVVDGDLRYTTQALTRAAGLAIFGKLRVTAGTVTQFGFDVNDTGIVNQNAIIFSFLTFIGRANAGAISQFGTYTLNTDYELCVVLMETGAAYLIRGGSSNNGGQLYPEWTLVWVDRDANSATVYGSFSNNDMVGAVDGRRGFRVANTLPGWGSYGKAVARKAVSVNSDTITSQANGQIEHTIVAATGVTQEFWVHRVDANNGYIIRMSQAGSTIKLIRIVAGVESADLNSVAQTWTNGTSYRISAYLERARITVYVNGLRVINNTTAAASLFQTATGVFVSHAGTNLIAWPYQPSIPSAFATASKGILTVGDSKTGGNDVPPTGTQAGYQRHLMDSLNVNGELAYMESPGRMVHGGFTTAQLAAVIDADIAAAFGTPNYILYNMGANDVAALPAEATFKANTLYNIDALHAAYPSAQIYVMRPWKRGELTDCNSIATWLSDLVALRPSFLHLGPDERVFLENGDDGVTYTSDGIHPNAAGYVLTASQWKTALGL